MMIYNSWKPHNLIHLMPWLSNPWGKGGDFWLCVKIALSWEISCGGAPCVHWCTALLNTFGTCVKALNRGTGMCKIIIEKSCNGRFLWHWNWDLGWILAGWHCWPFGLIMSNLWGRFFKGFVVKKKTIKTL